MGSAGAPCWVGVGRPQTPGASRAELQSTEAPPKSSLLAAPRVFLSAPTATEFGESVRTLRAHPPWVAQPCCWSPPPRHLSDSRLGARPTRKGLGEGAPLVSTCDGELNFSFTRCRGNAGGGDEWAGRGALRVNQLRRRPRGVPALARRCLGSAQRALLSKAQKGAAPEWMNSPTLSRVYSCLPLYSLSHLPSLIYTSHPNGTRKPLIAGGTHWTAFAEQPGRELCQWQAESIPSAPASPTLSVSSPGSPTNLVIPAHPRNIPGLPWPYIP